MFRRQPSQPAEDVEALKARIANLERANYAAGREVEKAKSEAWRANAAKEEAERSRNAAGAEARPICEVILTTGCCSALTFAAGLLCGLCLSGSVGVISWFTAHAERGPGPFTRLPWTFSNESGRGDVSQVPERSIAASTTASHLDMGGTSPALFEAVAGLTRELLSVANVLHAVGGMVMTVVYLVLMRQAYPKRIAITGWTLLYESVLLVVGLRLSWRTDYGSQVVGGCFLCVVSVVSPVLAACLTDGCLPSDSGDVSGVSSLADLPPYSRYPVTLMVLFAPLCGSATLLYGLGGGFPLLMIPANLGLYVLSVTFICIWLRYVPLLRRRPGLLQPEVLATFLFAVALLALSSSTAGKAMPAPVKLSLLVSSMNALIVAAPLLLFGLVELAVPRTSVEGDADREEWVTSPVWDVDDVCSEVYHMATKLQNTAAFAVAAVSHLTVWVVVMTASLRLHLWTCRPFALLSVLGLCAVIPRGGYCWTLGVKVPLGLWLLAVALYAEGDGGQVADPVLLEVLHWLGPTPRPFLVTMHSLLQVSAINSAMICFLAGLDAVRKELGKRSWVSVCFALLMTCLAFAAREGAKGTPQQAALSLWSCMWLSMPVALAPRVHSVPSRVILFLIYMRWVVLATSLDSFVLVVTSTVLLCLCFASFLISDLEDLPGELRKLQHNKTPAIVVALQPTVLVMISLVNSAKMPLALGCFMIYGLMGWTCSNGTLVARALVIGGCGIVTMLLADSVEAAIGPSKVAADALAKLIFQPEVLESLSKAPPDMQLATALLGDLVALISGQAGGSPAPAS